MKQLRYLLTGASALLMHSDVTANPLLPVTKELKKFTSKRKKTDEDYGEIARLEFLASLYYNEKQGYYMPSENIDATFKNAAKKFKLGTIYTQGVLIPNDSPFIFPDRDLVPDDLFKIEKYVDLRTVKVQMAKNIRCRPIFPEWSIEVELLYDEGIIQHEEILKLVEFAGAYIGLCDYRPRYGRFTSKIIA